MNKKIQKEARQGNSVLIFNLSTKLNFKELLELFRSYGKVLKFRSYFIPWKMKT